MLNKSEKDTINKVLIAPPITRDIDALHDHDRIGHSERMVPYVVESYCRRFVHLQTKQFFFFFKKCKLRLKLCLLFFSFHHRFRWWCFIVTKDSSDLHGGPVNFIFLLYNLYKKVSFDFNVGVPFHSFCLHKSFQIIVRKFFTLKCWLYRFSFVKKKVNFIM